MVIFWKVIITICILYIVAIDGNRARRRRRQTLLNVNPNPVGNTLNQPPNPQILNAQGPPLQQQMGQNDVVSGKQGGRQFYYPYQGQTGYGSIQGLNYPYAGAGVGSYQYGYGQYGQGQGYGQQGYGQGLGQYGGSYNQMPGQNNFYSGYNTGGYYNRPGSSNYYPSSGSNYYGGYFWNAAQRQHINLFSLLLTFIICLITV